MCLGIPGQVVSFVTETDQLANVEVSGVPRKINIGMIREEGVEVGDWVLVHMGLAMSIIDEAEAQTAMDGLKLLGSGLDPQEASHFLSGGR